MTPGVLLAGVLVLLAVVLLAPPTRRVRRPARRAVGPAAPLTRRRRRHRPVQLDSGLLVAEVAMRLRAGSDPDRAWTAALRRSGLPPHGEPAGRGGGAGAVVARSSDRELSRAGAAGAVEGVAPVGAARPAGAAAGESSGAGAELDESGVPVALLDLAGRLGGGPRSAGRPVAGRRAGPRLGNRAERASARGALAGVVAACRVTRATGAPLAEILDRSAAGIAESARAAGARTVALAGPRATGRLLGWLPLLGLLLGAAVGADPVGVLLDGGLGTVCLVVGTAFLVGGWCWVLREERRAETADA